MSEADKIDAKEFELPQNYVKPAQKSLNEILSTDANDESLVKYKEKLLGQNAENLVIDPSISSNCILKSIALEIDNDITNKVEFTKSQPPPGLSISIKEGVNYRIVFEFYVQREIITGLKYCQKTSRHGLPVDKESIMLGSYAPRPEYYTYKTTICEAPKGMLHRGKYKVRSLLTDDDENHLCEWGWQIEITK
uniref:RHO protein GDP dissociation inhibitor n=1 Tax=Strongyloides papillosus TaxID=174720 RepID=A0A0N5B7Z5_STREA